jgi:hypothetical protein
MRLCVFHKLVQLLHGVVKVLHFLLNRAWGMFSKSSMLVFGLLFTQLFSGSPGSLVPSSTNAPIVLNTVTPPVWQDHHLSMQSAGLYAPRSMAKQAFWFGYGALQTMFSVGYLIDLARFTRGDFSGGRSLGWGNIAFRGTQGFIAVRRLIKGGIGPIYNSFASEDHQMAMYAKNCWRLGLVEMGLALCWSLATARLWRERGYLAGWCGSLAILGAYDLYEGSQATRHGYSLVRF